MRSSSSMDSGLGQPCMSCTRARQGSVAPPPVVVTSSTMTSTEEEEGVPPFATATKGLLSSSLSLVLCCCGGEIDMGRNICSSWLLTEWDPSAPLPSRRRNSATFTFDFALRIRCSEAWWASGEPTVALLDNGGGWAGGDTGDCLAFRVVWAAGGVAAFGIDDAFFVAEPTVRRGCTSAADESQGDGPAECSDGSGLGTIRFAALPPATGCACLGGVPKTSAAAATTAVDEATRDLPENCRCLPGSLPLLAPVDAPSPR